MGNKLKVSYAKIPNMGDLLNELIIKDIFGYDIEQGNVMSTELTAIGSGLDMYRKKKSSSISKSIKNFACLFSNELNIWSTGFIEYNDSDIFVRKKINVAATRGELTKKRLEKICNKPLDIPTGDGGLLASLLLKEKVDKKYEVGIIPHFKEQDQVVFHQLKDNYEKSCIINLREDPIKVIEDIASCEYILSSSLHGLIVADSFNIPNIRVIAKNKLLGDGYKFDDYYSAFGINGESIDVLNSEIPTINEIIDKYKITEKSVNKKKEELIRVFPFK